eukprot:13632-Heterococcus_DN1.PRE.2
MVLACSRYLLRCLVSNASLLCRDYVLAATVYLLAASSVVVDVGCYQCRLPCIKAHQCARAHPAVQCCVGSYSLRYCARIL